MKTLQLAGLGSDTEAEKKASYPQEADVRFLLNRFYQRVPDGEKVPLNCERALDHNLAVRISLINCGKALDDSVDLPSTEDVYNVVWNIIPDFLKERIRQWAHEGQDGSIAREITAFVKQALAMLPIPVPGIFINTAANLIIPPLVTYIIGQITGEGPYLV